ncbi:MAG: glycerophosphodiester phosphodiesterase [Eubacteriales bacterium]|nr:glycerophosphodiester phosphodiesterase [Eubacteriales bacterium]
MSIDMTKVWAHRGASAYAPENTIPAFQMAMEMGADGLELDVHESSDGKLMVIHDERIDRTSNGTGRVADMTCQQLKKLDFSNGMPGYKDVRIPTLREVYGLIKDSRMTVNVEIKCDVVIYPGIWDKVISLEREMGMQGRIIYSSFNHYVLQKVRELDPDAEIGLLYANAMVDPWVYAKYLNANAIHPNYRAALLCPGLMEGCAKNGVAVNPWTVNEAKDVMALAAKGANAVITNCPDVALRALGR